MEFLDKVSDRMIVITLYVMAVLVMAGFAIGYAVSPTEEGKRYTASSVEAKVDAVNKTVDIVLYTKIPDIHQDFEDSGTFHGINGDVAWQYLTDRQREVIACAIEEHRVGHGSGWTFYYKLSGAPSGSVVPPLDTPQSFIIDGGIRVSYEDWREVDENDYPLPAFCSQTRPVTAK